MTSFRALPLLVVLTNCAPDGPERADPPAAMTVNQPAPQVSSAEPQENRSPGAPKPTASACDMQDGAELRPVRLRAVGTEPFWGARIQGRCVTYSHPEDQAGKRVWTHLSGSASSGVWTGSLDGQAFSLRTRPQADCSDGMSDRRYPIAVSLTVMGEERQGCAEPL